MFKEIKKQPVSLVQFLFDFTDTSFWHEARSIRYLFCIGMSYWFFTACLRFVFGIGTLRNNRGALSDYQENYYLYVQWNQPSAINHFWDCSAGEIKDSWRRFWLGDDVSDQDSDNQNGDRTSGKRYNNNGLLISRLFVNYKSLLVDTCSHSGMCLHSICSASSNEQILKDRFITNKQKISPAL